MMSLKNFIKKNRLYLLTILAWACLIMIVPFTADDWNWGSAIGAERFHNHFRNYSGRYLGNCIVLVLTRSSVLRVVIMSIGITAIPYLIEKITKVKINYIFTLALILLMDINMWQMTVVWTSGFANYVTSAVFELLFYVYLFKIIEDKYEKKDNILFGIGLLALGMANTLVMEHITIYNVILSIALIVYLYKKDKKVNIQYIMYSIGCIIGTVMMFTNSSFQVVSEGKDSYRSYSTQDGFLYRMKVNYFDKIYKFDFANNIWLNIALVVLLWILLIRKKDMFNKIKKILLYLYTTYVIWTIKSITGVSTPYTQKLKYLDGTIAFFGLVCLVALLIMLFWETKYRLHMIFLLGSNLFLVGPLFFVSPISARCFFLNYFLWILVFSYIIKFILENNCINVKIIAPVRKIVITGILALSVFYMSIYSVICVADVQRQKSIKKQLDAGKTEITIKSWPFKDYLMGAKNDVNIYGSGKGFKDFYKIPRNIKIKQVEPNSK